MQRIQRKASIAVDKESGCPIRVRHLDDVIENDVAHLRRKEVERPLRYEHLDRDDKELADRILRGGLSLDQLPCTKPNVVRMFVCSAGPDFDAERNYLFENIYPLVRQYCRENHGVDFQLIDMYWGDPEAPSCDTTRSAAVFRELRHCQNISMAPNIVVFAGQKYGSTSLPMEIPCSHMEKIKKALDESGHDVTLIETWYQKDSNVTPAVYRLHHVASSVENIADSDDEPLLLQLLQTGANQSLDPHEAARYSRSDFHQLVHEGVMEQDQASRDKNCLVYIRDIKHIEDHLNAKNVGNFVDIDSDSNTLDQHKNNQIRELRQTIEDNVTENNILKSTIELNGCKLDEKKSCDYVSSIGRHFYARVTAILDEQVDEFNEMCKDDLIGEVTRHWDRVTTSASPFTGREQILNAVKGYLLSDTDQPLVIYGEQGSGKSSLIAKAANDINEAITNTDLSMPTALVMRFIGDTGQSEDIQPLLLHLSHQLAYVTGRYRQDIPTEYKALKNYFIDLVQRGEYGGMIVILIDGLNLISDVDSGQKLDWLPSRIASNVKLVVTLDQENEDMLKRLENRMDVGIIELQDFSASDCENAIKVRMSEKKQTVNYNQWKRIHMAFNACPSPLFGHFVYTEASTWTSFSDIMYNILEHSVESFVHSIFDKLESKHGRTLVSKVLGYLSASRNGLSESEIEDILSLDDKLLNHLFIKNNGYPSIRRFPPHLWARLRQDLAPYLILRKYDGIDIYTWKFKVFIQVSMARYCPEESEQTERLYSNMADYFLGTWSGTRRKPFKHPSMLMAKYKLMNNEDESCRHVPSQPLSFGEYHQYNRRKSSQLPYLLQKSYRIEELKSSVFCNYDWLFCRLNVSSIERTIADFSIIDDRETSLVKDALKMSKSALTVDKTALGMELTGRLLPHIHKYPNVMELIRQCDLNAQRSCPLVPNCQIYSTPGGPLQYECDVGGGSKCPIDIDVFTSPDGILLIAKPYYSSRLQVWELMGGEERPDIMLPVGKVAPTRDGKYINIISEEKLVKTYTSDVGVFHGEVEFGPGKIADIDVANKYIAFVTHKGAGPYVVDIERSELLHKFTYHTHAVAISESETYVAFNSERSILLFELPVMQRKCVGMASDVAHDIIFVNETPKCYVMTKSKLIEAVQFDVINRKFTCKTIFTDLNAKECIPSNSKELMLVRAGKTIHVIDTVIDQVRARFQKLPPGMFVDSNSTFSGAGFTPNDAMIVASRYTYLIVWDAVSCSPIRVLQSNISPMTRLFTSDKVNRVVSLLENNTFQVWNLDNLDRDTRHSVEIHQGHVSMVAVSSSSGYALSLDDITPDAKLISLGSGRVVDTLQHSEHEGDKLVEVAFSPDGLYAVTRAKLEKGVNRSADTTFEVLTDDLLWEVETASKVFHAINNRYIIFSPSSEMAAFVTCSFYNRFDWSENIYNVFIVQPETASNYAIQFPFNTEFVAPPHLISTKGGNCFVAIIQTCKRAVDKLTQKEVSRWVEIRLFLHQLGSKDGQGEPTILRLENVAGEVTEKDNLLDVKPAPNGNVLIVYGKNVGPFDFETDNGLVTPKSSQKGAVIYDIDTQQTLKQIHIFMNESLSTDSLSFSSQYSYVIDGELQIFKYGTFTMIEKIQSVKLLPKLSKFALGGKYVIGISENRRKVIIVRATDDTKLGSVFVHGRATCIDVASDDRTVVVGCEDGRVMIFSLILELSDPLREYIEKLPSRSGEIQDDDSLILNDVKYISHSTPDQHRLSARIRTESVAEERRPPSYTTLHRAVTVSRQSSRQRNACIQQ